MADQPLALSATLPPDATPVTGNVTIRIGDDLIPISVTVPNEPTGFEPLLPIFQGFLGAMTQRGTARVERDGKTVSCRAGCGACCRQAVPIAAAEARAVARLVAAMPEPRRSRIVQRFAAGRAALDAAGVDHGEVAFAGDTVQSRLDNGMAYFRAGVACPFLEDENCSIHPVRPLACREYLVTTPAKACEMPTMDTIDTVPIGGSLAQAVMAAEAVMDGHGRVLLIDALAFAKANPAPEPEHSGPSMVKAVFDILAKLSG
jgi:Fe-S-cluster containining protein